MIIHSAHNNKWGTLLVSGSLLALGSWAATTTAVATGSVVDDSGRPVGGARVLISQALPAGAPQFAPPPVVTGPSVTMVAADSSGIFSIGSLPAGQYVACAEVTTPGLLDPCHWAASAPTFTVSAGTTTAGVNITMARGAVVPIHIDDPLALLQPVSASAVSFDFQVHVVTSKGLHYNAAVQGSSATSRDLAVTVPFGTPLMLRVISAHLTVNDQTGQPVSPLGVSMAMPSGTSPSTVGYVITGTK
jgi:hypothetical protein